MGSRWKYVLLGAAAALLLTGALATAFIFSGLYPIAANEPHTGPVAWVLTELQENAVRVHSDGDMAIPDLADPNRIADGLTLYHVHCVLCHGAPGMERAILGRGLNPDPPRLATEIRDWTDPELFWIVANGLKMAGMPAFQPGLRDDEVWATVAFMRALPRVTPEQYRLAVEAGGGAEPGTVASLLRPRTPSDPPTAPGDPERGRILVGAFGCGSCHEIPGIANARGQVGPPLDRFGLRHYIAGAVLNTPDNLTLWLMDPERIEPGTAMPAVGASPEEASDMAAYLASLGTDRSLVGPRSILPASWLPRR